jgi:tyrosine-protein kinase Etk/Wzc
MNENLAGKLDASFLRSRDAWKRIAVVACLVTLAGAAYAFLSPSWYRSVLTVVPATPPKSSNVSSLLGGDLGGALGASLGSAPDSARIAAVLQSVGVADAVIEKFDLKKRYDVKYQEAAREELWSHCEVKPVQKPNLVQLSCEDQDPRFVEGLLAYFAEHGNKVFRRVSVSSATEEVHFLERRVADLRQQADELAARMREFQEKHQIVDLDSQARALVSSVAALNTQRIARQLELEYARTYSSKDEATSRQLASQVGVVEEVLRDLEERREPATPAAGAGKGAAGSGPGMFPPALAIPKLRSEYERLFRDRKVAETTLIFALDRLENARATEARDVSTFQVLDAPTVPQRRTRPRRTTILLGAVAIGLVVGIGREWWRSGQMARALAPVPRRDP